MRARELLPIITLFMLVGCQTDGNGTMTANEASDIANALLSEELPQVPLNMLQVQTEDLGGRWRVTYETPGGSTGGPIILDVDKRSGVVAVVAGAQ